MNIKLNANSQTIIQPEDNRKDNLTMLRDLYNKTIREQLPRDLQVLNGVAVKSRRFLDKTLVHESHEKELIDAINSAVQSSDNVVVVGAGYGVSTVRAARIGKHVTAYEAAESQYELASKTVQLNKISNAVVHHAIVGKLVKSAGPTQSAKRVSPTDLPSADVLVLDCEGAEIEILSNLEMDPREIVVETHGWLDATTKDVLDLLTSRGYESNVTGTVDEEIDCRIIHASK